MGGLRTTIAVISCSAGIVSVYFPLDDGINARAISVDGCLRVGPRRHPVGIVAGPQKIVLAVNGCRQHTGAVVLVAEVSIPFEIFARRELVDIFLRIEGAGAPTPVVDLLHETHEPPA